MFRNFNFKNDKIAKGFEPKIEIKPLAVKLDFRYFIYQAFKYKDFINFTKTESEYKKVLDSLFRDFIPYCDNKNISEIQNDSRHNHYIENESNQRVINIMKYCKENGLTNVDSDNIGDEDYFQLYTPNGIRVISVLYGTTFFILFVDPHHLIYPDEKFNKDYKNYTYTPKLVNEDRVIKFDDIEIEECYNCTHMENYINNKN